MRSVRTMRGVPIGSVRIAALSRRSAVLALLAALCAEITVPCAAAEPIRIVALGDSLTAGFGLADFEAFPVKLEVALRARGHDVRIANAGVSGDTASSGLARLDWSVPAGTDAVILELGANDALRGVDPKITRNALETIVRRLRERRIEVLVAGMQAPRNLGGEYSRDFDQIFPDVAKDNGALLYPFFLDGVATEAKLNQRDGIHPTAAGVDVIVARVLPSVEELIARAKAGRKR